MREYVQKVSEIVKGEIIKHKYNFWPVNFSTEIDLDTLSLEKISKTASVFYSTSGKNRFEYDDGNKEVNLRSFPSPGDPHTGPRVELFGDAIVTFPECAVVRAKEQLERFKYVYIGEEKITNS